MKLHSCSIIHQFAGIAFAIIFIVLCIFLFSVNTARAEGEFLLSIGDRYQIPCLSQLNSGQEYEILIENPDIVGLDETGKCIVGVAAGTTEVTVILYDPGAVYAYVFTVLSHSDQPAAAFNDGMGPDGSEWGEYETTGEDPFYGAANTDTPEQNEWEDAAWDNSGNIIRDDTDRSNSGQNGGSDSDGQGYGQNGGSDSDGQGYGQSGWSDTDKNDSRTRGRSDIDGSGSDMTGSNSAVDASGYNTTETENDYNDSGEYMNNTGTADQVLSDEVTDCPVFITHGTGKYDILVPSHYTLWISVRSRRPFAVLYVGADGMPIPYHMDKYMIYIKSDDIPPGHHLIQVIVTNAANQIFAMDDYHIYR